MENKVCRQCSQKFTVEDEDLRFYHQVSPTYAGKKFEIPSPVFCPDCRNQRRLAFRDLRKLYHRKCDFTGEDMISVFSPDKKYKVYSNATWWSDKWDAMDFGRDFDAAKSFFKQFAELSKAVPHMQQAAYDNENCPYVNRCSYCKDCYLCFNADNSEDSFYSDIIHELKSSVDCSASKVMENSYWCQDCIDCQNSSNLWKCSNLSESQFCFDCHGSSNLILCWGLRNKQYCIENVQYTKEEYNRKREILNLTSNSSREKLKKKLLNISKEKAIHKFANNIKSENCTGENVISSKNCKDCYDVYLGENLIRVMSVDDNAKDSMDSTSIWNGAELEYEVMSCSQYNIQFSMNVWESRDMMYCELCRSCKNCFGCVGLKHKEYCILNKQYPKGEYEKKVAEIIEHMQITQEWGEFFPINISPFGYNETEAFDFYPLDKEEAIKITANWQDNDFATKYPGDYYKPKDDIREYEEEQERNKLLSGVIKCQRSGKPFKILPQELAFYLANKIPIPTLHYDERFNERFKLKNPRRLYHRQCMNEGCNNEFETTYAPERPEKVYCESCYQKEII